MTFDRRTLLRRAAAASILGAIGMPTMLAAAERPMLDVAKSPTCGCCTAWADLARAAGYAVRTTDVDDMEAVKAAAGVPPVLASCHTATLRTPDGRGYVIEGHVPFEAIERLLAERPDVAGLAVPGMPVGSPGMGDDPAARYDVVAWGGTAGEGAVFMAMGAA